VLTTALQLGQAVGVAVLGSVFLTLTGRGPGGSVSGAPTAAAVSGHALYVTLTWAALAMALAVAAAIPLARTVLAARRAG
jgi:cytochrome oxidase assembly protein ShyY1